MSSAWSLTTGHGTHRIVGSLNRGKGEYERMIEGRNRVLSAACKPRKGPDHA